MIDEAGNEVTKPHSIPAGSFYKRKATDKIWWVMLDPDEDSDGGDFSFDRVHIYNTYQDYHDLPKYEKEIFDLENPFWAVHLNGGAENVSEKVREAYKKEMGYYPK